MFYMEKYKISDISEMKINIEKNYIFSMKITYFLTVFFFIIIKIYRK